MSTKSWDDCAGVKKEVNCSADENRCYKAFASVKNEGASVEAYEKGCVSAAVCDAFDKSDFCKGKGECKIDCCTGDLCNAAALPMISAIIITTCALVAFVF